MMRKKKRSVAVRSHLTPNVISFFFFSSLFQLLFSLSSLFRSFFLSFFSMKERFLLHATVYLSVRISSFSHSCLLVNIWFVAAIFLSKGNCFWKRKKKRERGRGRVKNHKRIRRKTKLPKKEEGWERVKKVKWKRKNKNRRNTERQEERREKKKEEREKRKKREKEMESGKENQRAKSALYNRTVGNRIEFVPGTFQSEWVHGLHEDTISTFLSFHF